MCGELPIRFYHRGLEKLAFRLFPSVPVAKRLIAFIFHPTEPLALSVQKTNQDFQLNIHLRHSSIYAREQEAEVAKNRKNPNSTSLTNSPTLASSLSSRFLSVTSVPSSLPVILPRDLVEVHEHGRVPEAEPGSSSSFESLAYTQTSRGMVPGTEVR